MGYDADPKKLELEEQLEKLMPIEDAGNAIVVSVKHPNAIFSRFTDGLEEPSVAVARDDQTWSDRFGRNLRDQCPSQNNAPRSQ